MNLDQIQRGVFDAVRQPLTADENMRQRTRDGRSTREIAEAIIKPNDRLTSFERLEIYNRQYWLRILSALAEDFEGLRLIIGDKAFEKLSVADLVDCHSQSFALRNMDPVWSNGCGPIRSTRRVRRTSRSTWYDSNGPRSRLSTRHRSRV